MSRRMRVVLVLVGIVVIVALSGVVIPASTGSPNIIDVLASIRAGK